MIKKILPLLLINCLLLITPAHAAISVKDGTGQLVTLQQPAKRIISLTPHTTELLFSAGAGQYIVGVTNESDYPTAAINIPKVGTYNQISLDAILRLKPDLVITWQDSGHIKEINRLKQLNIPVFVSHPLKLNDIATETLKLGQLTQTENTAKNSTQAFFKQAQSLKKQYQHKQKIKTLVAVSESPIYTVSNQSFLGQLVTLCGGENVFSSLKTASAQVSKEAIMKSQAQVVLTTLPNLDKSFWYNTHLPAAKTKNIYTVSDANRPSLRLIDAATSICQHIERARQH